ncbi:protein of unknown function (plasmid) [Cupriavidus neocaledonicus]|uniref:Uncharacterized protein n=1 Tax=Cupriavidus neocaledonicus TaxID=1040979 RepID=A0A375HNV2_9BURK|nr:hypothetical protein CBM2605_B150063 [Cupriavidus neocaledonicus]SPD59043.1 protein of unknown function [Cupriavidus neocaledonicus]
MVQRAAHQVVAACNEPGRIPAPPWTRNLNQSKKLSSPPKRTLQLSGYSKKTHNNNYVRSHGI